MFAGAGTTRELIRDLTGSTPCRTPAFTAATAVSRATATMSPAATGGTLRIHRPRLRGPSRPGRGTVRCAELSSSTSCAPSPISIWSSPGDRGRRASLARRASAGTASGASGRRCARRWVTFLTDPVDAARAPRGLGGPMPQPMGRALSWGRQTLTRPGLPGVAATTALGMLASGRHQLRHVLQRRYPTVAVTGMTGVGKTVLVDRLCHRSSAAGPVEAGSAVMEYRTRRGGNLRGFRFRVVPGENAATRLGALDEVFHDDAVD